MQDVLVYLIVAGAAFYLFQTWRGSSRGGGCGSCKSCGPEKQPETLIQISLGGAPKGRPVKK